MEKIEQLNAALAATNLNGLATLVKAMRDAQKAYFAARRTGSYANAELAESRSLEKQVDAAVATVLDKQGSLI